MDVEKTQMKISEEYPELLKADGFDEAVVGVVQRMGIQAICYDQDKVLSILMKDMSEEEAIEYFDYNIAGAWVGESTPFYLIKMEL
jgi:hypothetical protein